jgi:L-fuconolactonase
VHQDDGVDLIDAHTHVLSTDLDRYPIVPGIADEQAWYRDHPVDTDELLAKAETAGVCGVALVQAISCHGYDNRYVLDSARAHPGRAIAVGAVRVDDPAAPTQVARLVRDHGMHGVRVMAPVGSDTIDDERVRRIVRAAAECAIPVVLLAVARQMHSVGALVSAFPGVTFVLDHCGFVDLRGGPDFPNADALFGLSDHENLVCKVSSMTLQSSDDAEGLWLALARRFDAARLLWGTDYPHTHNVSYDRLVVEAVASTRALSDGDRQLVLSGTSRRVWPAFA